MKTGLLRAVALPGAVFQSSPFISLKAQANIGVRPIFSLLLATLALLCSTGIGIKAQNTPAPQLRRIAPLRSLDVPEGSRVTITSDTSLDDYTAYRSLDRFHVLIPQAQLSSAVNNLRGRGFTGLQIERRGADLELSFNLQPGATAKVSQKFNRLDVIFNAPADAAAIIANTATQVVTSLAQAPANELAKQRRLVPSSKRFLSLPLLSRRRRATSRCERRRYRERSR